MESVVPIIDGAEPASAESGAYSSNVEESSGAAAVRSGDGVARGGIGTGGGGSTINDGIHGNNVEVAMGELKAATQSAKAGAQRRCLADSAAATHVCKRQRDRRLDRRSRR